MQNFKLLTDVGKLDKPVMLKQVFEALRKHPAWTSHVRNRGLTSTDEIEIVLARDFSKPVPFSLRP